MHLILIAALARNRVIGKKGKIPWDLPEDMRLFQERTTGHCILMGRRTFDLLPAPLPDRRNVVVTHRPLQHAEAFPSLDDALAAVEHESDVYVIGGGTIYEQTIGRADGMVLSHVDLEPEGDVFFPPFAHLIGSEFVETARAGYRGFELVEYTRVRRSGR